MLTLQEILEIEDDDEKIKALYSVIEDRWRKSKNKWDIS